MNKATLIGRFAADPELKTTNSGKSVVSFTLAVDRPGTYGENKKTDFIDFIAWNKTAEFICRNFSKGEPIGVEGSIQTRVWEDKNGQKRKSVEVVAENVEFLPAAKLKAAQENAEPLAERSQENAEGFQVADDEDLPF